MRDSSAEAHHERMQRGVAAVVEYLRAQFPDSVVEVVEPPSNDDNTRGIRTFKVRGGDKKHRLRVVDEVLDLDAAGVSRHLEQFRVEQTLRAAGARNAILVTTDAIRLEPI